MIKYYIKIFIMLICGLVIQILMQKYMSIFNVAPQVLMLNVIFFALIKGSLFGEMYGFTCGLFIDAFSISPFGTNAFILTLIGYIFGMFSHKLDEAQLSVHMVSTVIASFFYLLVMVLIFSVSGIKKQITIPMLVVVPLYNLVLAPFLFVIFARLNQFLNKR
jgi:rod shape-determining protein MreD